MMVQLNQWGGTVNRVINFLLDTLFCTVLFTIAVGGFLSLVLALTSFVLWKVPTLEIDSIWVLTRVVLSLGVFVGIGFALGEANKGSRN